MSERGAQMTDDDATSRMLGPLCHAWSGTSRACLKAHGKAPVLSKGPTAIVVLGESGGSMATHFNTPPGWPEPPAGWLPDPGWKPEPSWPKPPEGWALLIDDEGHAVGGIVGRVANNVLATDADTAPTADELWRSQSKNLVGPASGRYRLTTSWLYFEQGRLTTRAQQVPIGDVWDVDVTQSLSQKARSVGTVILWVARPQGRERVVMEDLPDFRHAQRVITDAALAARHFHESRRATLANTHRYELQQGASPGPIVAGLQAVPSPAPLGSEPEQQALSGASLTNRLRQLAEMREQGLITQEEFDGKKAEILDQL